MLNRGFSATRENHLQTERTLFRSDRQRSANMRGSNSVDRVFYAWYQFTEDSLENPLVSVSEKSRERASAPHDLFFVNHKPLNW